MGWDSKNSPREPGWTNYRRKSCLGQGLGIWLSAFLLDRPLMLEHLRLMSQPAHRATFSLRKVEVTEREASRNLFPMRFSWVCCLGILDKRMLIGSQCFYRLGVLVSLGSHNKMAHRLGGLINRNFFLSFRVWEVQDQGRFIWGLLSQFGGGCYLCACMTSSLCTCGKGEGASSLAYLLIRIQIPLDQGPTLMTSFNLNNFLRGSISKYNHMGLKASTYEFGGGTQTFSP